MPGCKPILTVEFAPVISIVPTAKCTTEAEKCTLFGRKTCLSTADLLTILDFLEPLFLQ
jgi:hypothetical protein